MSTREQIVTAEAMRGTLGMMGMVETHSIPKHEIAKAVSQAWNEMTIEPILLSMAKAAIARRLQTATDAAVQNHQAFIEESAERIVRESLDKLK